MTYPWVNIECAAVADSIPAWDPASNAFLPILGTLVERLDDQFDHPEIWPLLADAARHDDVVELRNLIELLIPQQRTVARKSLNLLGGMLHALAVDRDEGLSILAQMTSQFAHCPQIAGAIFFVERQGTEKSPDLSNRFCDALFVTFETLMDGTVAPCCSIWTQQRLGTLDGQTFGEIWNSGDAKAMRSSILDGSYRYCNKQRCTFINEDALPFRDEVVEPGMRAVIDNGITHMDAGPRWLFLAHDVTCNLACPSCRGAILAADEAQEARFEKIEREVFRPLLNAEGEVLISVSGQGDPWSSPHYRSILRYMTDHHVNAQL